MKRRTLLLLDDDPLIRRALKRALREHYEVDDVATIDEAKESVLAEPPDLALLDLFDQDRATTGLDLLPWLAEHSPRTAPILLSGSAQIAHAERAMRRGAVAFLEKPVEIGHLRSVLETWSDELP